MRTAGLGHMKRWSKQALRIIKYERSFKLTAEEHNTFMLLLFQINTIVPYEALDPYEDVAARNITRVTVKRLRGKLPWWLDIITVKEVGYILTVKSEGLKPTLKPVTYSGVVWD